jgi:hypothetical protein
VTGEVSVDGQSVKEFNWVTKAELGEVLGGDYWEYADKIL